MMASAVDLVRILSNWSKKIKENTKAPRHWPLCGEFTAQKASNAKNVSIWWPRHAGEVVTSIACTDAKTIRGPWMDVTEAKSKLCEIPCVARVKPARSLYSAHMGFCGFIVHTKSVKPNQTVLFSQTYLVTKHIGLYSRMHTLPRIVWVTDIIQACSGLRRGVPGV